MSPPSPLEIVGAAAALLSVWLTVRRHIWCWPIGLVSVVAYAVFFRQIKLYADMWLQVFFFFTGIQGWYWWLRGGDTRTELPITSLTPRQRLQIGAVTALCIATVGYLHARFTDADLPFWDAAASGMSVTAQLLMTRKKIECWHLWAAVNLLSVGIYLSKSLTLTTGLYALFLVLALLGLRDWSAVRRAAT